MYHRILNMELPKKQSAFLWGARKTGKSTYLKNRFSEAVRYDFLQSRTYFKFIREPYLFSDEVLALSKEKLAQPIIVDEVQKIPIVLDEIHWLIENSDAQFILCGSSARKLKRGAANLLGGRAWRYHFYPLVYPEVSDFDLLKVLNYGLVPSHYLSDKIEQSLEAYIDDYLREEVQAEGLTRNLPAFSNFLNVMAFSHGEMINYSNIARDCGIDSKTVKEYFQILEDTLLGYYLRPFLKRENRNVIRSAPKFYLLDVGVANFLARREIKLLKGSEAGKAFEHYILMELMAYRGLNARRFDINYWRTKTGLEVDFILDHGRIAIEIKISEVVRKQELRGLLAFQSEHHPEKSYVVSQDLNPRKMRGEQGESIDILPWREFLERLWAGEII